MLALEAELTLVVIWPKSLQKRGAHFTIAMAARQEKEDTSKKPSKPIKKKEISQAAASHAKLLLEGKAMRKSGAGGVTKGILQMVQ